MFDSKKFCVCSALFLLEIIGSVLTYPTFGHPDAHLGGGGFGDHGGFHGGFQEAHSLVSNDHHGGVSIIGAGGSANKGITIDLTKEHGGGHDGLFGGSFISTGAHGKTGGYYQGGGDVEQVHTDHGLGAYSSALSSYDVSGSGGGAHALASAGHDDGEISPVLYSSFKEGEHHFGLHAGDFSGGHHAAFTAPAHFGGGMHFDHSSGFGH